MGWMESFQLLHSNDGIAGNLKQMLTSILPSLKEISIFNMLKSLYITWYQFSYGLLKKKIPKPALCPLRIGGQEVNCSCQGARLTNLTSERMSGFQKH